MKTQTTVKPTQEENNQLIAEFMGKACWAPYWNNKQTHYVSYRRTKADCMNLICGSQLLYSMNAKPGLIPLHYHSDWNWLIPVIEKISKLNLPDPDNCSESWQPFPRTFGMANDDNGYFMFRFNRYGIHEAPVLIDAAYSAVVELLSGLKLRQKGGSDGNV